MNTTRHPSSYRDPSGFIFEHDGAIYRQINRGYADNYILLTESGLFDRLVSSKLMVGHVDVANQLLRQELVSSDLNNKSQNQPAVHNAHSENDLWKIIRPEQIECISYPAEWSFDALKDAALLHLDIMKVAVSHGMILKDATPYNVQFVKGKAIFIDTLSFQVYNESLPWIAYRQFCESFLYPLLLEHYKLIYTHQLYAGYPEGISAAETAKLLPFRSRFSLGCWLHVFLPASVSKSTNPAQTKIVFSRQKLLNLVSHLRQQVSNLKSNDKSPAAWNTYYAETILSEEYLSNKKTIVAKLTEKLSATTALDLGCNDGYFSRLMHNQGMKVLAIDNDAPSINRLFLQAKKDSADITSLVVDITAPTPATGFMNLERNGFLSRLNCELVLALALIHHLVIGKNIPLTMLASFFKDYAKWLVIEFVPKDDPKVIAMLSNREDIFSDYNEQQFEQSIGEHFELLEKTTVAGTKRSIYLFKKRN